MGLCWSDSNEVFVPEIDAEHRVLFRRVDELRRAIKSAGKKKSVSAGLRALLSETEAHFAREERLMGSYRFWGTQWHKSQHTTARKHLRRALKANEDGDRAAADRELKFMGSWLNDHTSIADRIFGAFLRNHVRTATSHR